VISQPTSILTTASTSVIERVSDTSRLASVSDLWRATLHTLSAYSAPILTCALLGLVGAQLLGALVNALLTFYVYFQSGGIFPVYSSTFYAQTLLQAGIGAFSISLARGAISYIALSETSGVRVTLRQALRASAARLPALLFSSLLYGVLILTGIAGLTLLLRQLRLDITSVGRVSIDFNSILRVVAVRVINGFLPDPGSPFSELVNYARYLLRRTSSNYYWLYTYRSSLDDVQLRIWLIGLASLVPMIACGTVLRLRVAAIMSSQQPNQLSALYDGIQLGSRHTGYIFKHGATLWLASSCVMIVFVIIPEALSQYLLVPTLAREINTLWPYPASTLLFAIGSALISMVIVAFMTIYDAHIYTHLTTSK
jgi:hypothetical protein